jgi:sirohydrochlorin cobaltochelatase
VQSLQVIPGEEFSRVVNAMKDFGNNVNGDLDDTYMSQVTLKLGMPLMYTEDDATILASALDVNFSNYAAEGAMLFMGHGNPDEYDTYKANVRYDQLETALQTISPKYFVGTVDMKENFKVQVRKRMQDAGMTSGKVFCAPLMSIAGDHAHNDMAGNDDAWDMDTASFEENEDGEVEDTSWKRYFLRSGYEIDETDYTDGEEGLVHGLLEYTNILNIYIQHTKDAEVVDYYHSMYPEE